MKDRVYSSIPDQAALTKIFDMEFARRNSDSFDNAGAKSNVYLTKQPKFNNKSPDIFASTAYNGLKAVFEEQFIPHPSLGWVFANFGTDRATGTVCHHLHYMPCSARRARRRSDRGDFGMSQMRVHGAGDTSARLAASRGSGNNHGPRFRDLRSPHCRRAHKTGNPASIETAAAQAAGETILAAARPGTIGAFSRLWHSWYLIAAVSGLWLHRRL